MSAFKIYYRPGTMVMIGRVGSDDQHSSFNGFRSILLQSFMPNTIVLMGADGNPTSVLFGTIGVILTGARVYNDRRYRMFHDKVEVMLSDGRHVVTCPAALIFPHQSFDLNLMQN